MLLDNEKDLSLGTSTFSVLRGENEIYVDKSGLFYELCRRRNKLFLSRPRRFGKSLLISTFESLFKYGLRDFSGLAIEKIWRDSTYRVVRLDFGVIKDFGSAEDFAGQFLSQLAASFSTIGYEGKADLIDLGLWLERQPDNSIVLLIDEYDAPLTACLGEPEKYEAVQRLISQLFLRLKSNEGCLRFFFLTGITRLSNTGIFSGINNLQDISLNLKYGALLGWTEREIEDNFAPYIRLAAEERACSQAEVMTQLRLHYDGFCFDKKASEHVYCPWSVLNFFNDPSAGFENYWYSSGGHPAVLMKYLKNHPLGNPLSYAEPKDVRLSDLSASQTCDDLQLETLLFQAGYLTIQDVSENQVATLNYPNEEVAQSMAQLYADELLGGKAYKEPKGPAFRELLARGSLDEIAGRINDVFNSLDYLNFPVRDEALCRAMMQVLLIGARLVPRVESHTARGRSEQELSAGGRHWVFEIKFARTDAEVQKLLAEGAAQMQERLYGETIAGRSAGTLLRAVLVFSSEKRKFAAWTLV